MVKKIEHIGVVVKDLETSMKRYAYLLGLEVKETEEVKVKNSISKIAFFPVGQINIELIQPSAEIALLNNFNRERDGIHHIAFEVEALNLSST